ncbi:hypothetical protein F442_16547 [Phytophthora nicotianae P10297]|uniref:Uncharacterized protein n=1 Tax=Phytophthora nicotianae P10297 TaxID=1317064 RepID=W2YK08_PHYNI|nr:hypothetical protein F442_16547 [Phytophthora nicotianae P10297]
MATTASPTTTSSQLIDDATFELEDLYKTNVPVDVDVADMVSLMPFHNTTNSKSKRKDLLQDEGLTKDRVYRGRKKDMLESLRLLDKELTKALVDLRQQKESEKSEFLSSRTPLYFIWEAHARQQKEYRLQAEADQRQLYAAVRLQSSYIHNLHDILQKRRADQEELSKKRRLILKESALVCASIKELEENYTRTEEVFRTSGLSALPDTEVTVRSVHTRDCDGEVEYYQQLSRLVQPFSLRETGHTMWELGEMQYSNKLNYQRSYDVEDPENTIALSFVELKKLKCGASVPLVQRCIVRRFVDEECIIHTWKFITEGADICKGMQVEETGWCRLIPSANAAEPGTQIELCIRRVPMHLKSAQYRELEIGEFHDALQEVSDGTLNDVMTKLESLLLDDVLAGIA